MDARCGDNNKVLNLKKKKKKIEKLQEKAIRVLPNNVPVLKETHKLKILKLEGFITLQN